MPFVTEEHRKNPDSNIPGDRCYVEYSKLMDSWKASPRWSTVDEMLFNLGVEGAWKRAKILAFLVFFCLAVVPYEIMKQKENGDI
jgi:hypothetical protein